VTKRGIYFRRGGRKQEKGERMEQMEGTELFLAELKQANIQSRRIFGREIESGTNHYSGKTSSYTGRFRRGGSTSDAFPALQNSLHHPTSIIPTTTRKSLVPTPSL
jgi:hypothetical protein